MLGCAFVLLALAALAPQPACARDLVVYTEPTLRATLEAVGELWRSRSGVSVHVFAARTELSMDQIERGARCDVLVGLSGAPLEDAERRKLIDRDRKMALLRNSLVLIAREAVSPTSLRLAGGVDALLSGKRLAIADPQRDPGGRYAVSALRNAGLTRDFNTRELAVAESSAGVLTFLAEDKADYGIVYSSDARSSAFSAILILEEKLYPPIEYVAAQTAEPQGKPGEFFQFLGSDAARVVYESFGLRPMRRSSEAKP